MRDDEKLGEFTDPDGNLRVDRLCGPFEARNLSILEYGANGAEVNARRDAGGPTVNGRQQAAATGAAMAHETIRRLDIRRMATTFEGVLNEEFATWFASMYHDALWSTIVNILWSDDIEDRGAAIGAACDAFRDIVVDVLMRRETTRGTGGPTKQQIIEAVRAATSGGSMTISKEQFEALQREVEQLKGAVATETKRTSAVGAAAVSILRAMGLPDDFLDQQLGQYSFGGSGPMGDLVSRFQQALGAIIPSGGVGLANILNRAKDAVTSGELTERLNGFARDVAEGTAQALADVRRGVLPTPPGAAGGDPNGGADGKVLTGLGEQMRGSFGQHGGSMDNWMTGDGDGR